MPLLGFGTYQIPGTVEGRRAIQYALTHGYRLLDCASFYFNEATVGDAISDYGRENLFVVSKVWNNAVYAGPTAVRESCVESIRNLYVSPHIRASIPIESANISTYT